MIPDMPSLVPNGIKPNFEEKTNAKIRSEKMRKHSRRQTTENRVMTRESPLNLTFYTEEKIRSEIERQISKIKNIQNNLNQEQKYLEILLQNYHQNKVKYQLMIDESTKRTDFKPYEIVNHNYTGARLSNNSYYEKEQINTMFVKQVTGTEWRIYPGYEKQEKLKPERLPTPSLTEHKNLHLDKSFTEELEIDVGKLGEIEVLNGKSTVKEPRKLEDAVEMSDMLEIKKEPNTIDIEELVDEEMEKYKQYL